jgi:translocator protein
MRWLSLLTSLGCCLTVGAIGGRWTAPAIPTWYRGLRKPFFNPPNGVFAPVWTTLYLLMGVAAWRIAVQPESAVRTLGLSLFVVQLALNLAWSWIFFRRHAMGAALVEMALLWAAIAATLGTFAQVDRAAAWLLAPYLAWVSFAALLNLAIWRLNTPHAEPLARTGMRR